MMLFAYDLPSPMTRKEFRQSMLKAGLVMGMKCDPYPRDYVTNTRGSLELWALLNEEDKVVRLESDFATITNKVLAALGLNQYS